MNRKKWTAKSEVTESLIHFREKRKWQIALRRYVLEKSKSSVYAPYYGLDIEKFREWIQIQFDEDLNWNNFSKSWQFDHIIPVAYFDFSEENDLRLCWNFTNIRVEKISLNNARGNRIDILGAKNYFEDLFRNTGYKVCGEMVEKITRIELSQMAGNEKVQNFIVGNKEYLEATATLSVNEFAKLNTGTSLKSLLFEKEFLKKFGG